MSLASQILGEVEDDPSVYELFSWDLPGRGGQRLNAQFKLCERKYTSAKQQRAL